MGTLYTGILALNDTREIYIKGTRFGFDVFNNKLLPPVSPVLVAGNHSFSSISRHSMAALKDNGEAWTWGSNTAGELGTETLENELSPVQVVGNHSFKNIIKNNFNTIALKEDGSVWAWGYNNSGQLGDNSLINKSSPIQVVGGHSFIKISLGGNFCLALKNNGEVWSWGQNDYGQLGNNTFSTSVSSPVLVVGGHSFIDIDAGILHSLALKANGEVWSWGYGVWGGLGDNTVTNKKSPVLVVGGHVFSKISAGVEFSLAIKVDKSVWAWGRNDYGQFGNSNNVNTSSPIAVNYSFSDIVTNRYGSVGLDDNGKIWGWGTTFYFGYITEDEWISTISSPVLIIDSSFTQIGLGQSQNIAAYTGVLTALKANGEVWTWGYNNLDLGNYQGNIISPITIFPGSYKQISAGGQHGLILDHSGQVWSWGSNSRRQLGCGDIIDKTSPVLVLGGHSFIYINTSNNASFGLKANGELWTWGYIYGYDNFAYGDNDWEYGKESPIRCAVGGHVFTKISGGAGWTLGLKANGEAWSWGLNTYGQLGYGDINITWRSSPVLVVGGHSFIDIAASSDTNGCGLKANGEAWCWGWGTVGTVGDNTTKNKISPVQVVGNLSFIKISGGDSYFLALKDNGEIWGWGGNDSGLLGDNSRTNRSSPVQVVGGHSFIDICAAGVSLALKDNGEIWSWGLNSFGQLGDNTILAKSSPILVIGNHSFIKIAALEYNSLALKADGSVWTWGHNNKGQLGDNTTTNKGSPVQVVGGHSFIDITSNGYGFMMALKANGEVWGWGRNDYRQLCDGTLDDKSSPVQVVGGHSFSSIYSGWYHMIALKANETWGWGESSYGDLGQVPGFSKIPQLVPGGHSFISVSSGQGHVVALKANGEVWSWGNNNYGNLGDEKEFARSNPVLVVGGHSFIQISCGDSDWTLALKTNGEVWAWGSGGYLGDDTYDDRSSPVLVLGGHSFIKISAGGEHSMALKADGSVWTWGWDSYGELGTFLPITTTPTQVVGGDSFIQIYAGSYNSIALKANGEIFGWGLFASGFYVGNQQFSQNVSYASPTLIA